MRCAKSISCPAYFVLDESNASIDGAIEAMKENKAYRDTIKTPEQAAQMMRSSSLLIIVDTQRKLAAQRRAAGKGGQGGGHRPSQAGCGLHTEPYPQLS